MSDDTATHVLCPRCSSFQPIIWTPVTVAQVAGARIGEFKGLEMKCRACDFLITKVGRVSQTKLAA